LGGKTLGLHISYSVGKDIDANVPDNKPPRLLHVLRLDLEYMLEERDRRVVVEPGPWAGHMV
jgi:hypothetical protein